MGKPELLKNDPGIRSQAVSDGNALSGALQPSDSKVFCVLPWTNLTVRPNGDVFPCYAMRSDQAMGRLRGSSLGEVWNSDALRRLRLDILDGRESSCCQGCYALEAAGNESPRQDFNRVFSSHRNLVSATAPDGALDPAGIVRLDIEPSNVCNYSCRYCDHTKSTAWHRDHVSLWGSPGKEVVLSALNPSALRDQIADRLGKLSWIRFSGGEPLISEAHHKIIQLLVERERFDVRLSYSTNFSVTSYRGTDFLETWARFREVDVGVSLDASGARGEYIRKHQSWISILENRKRLARKCPNVRFSLCPTLNVMNVLHLPDFHQESIEQGIISAEEFYVTPVVDPEEYSVQILPQDLKRRAAEKYERHMEYLAARFPQARKTRADFQDARDFMLKRDLSHLLGKFRRRTHLLDNLRGENFAEVFPELASLMDGGVNRRVPMEFGRTVRDPAMGEFVRQRKDWLSAKPADLLQRIETQLPPPPKDIAGRLDFEFEWKIINRCNYRCSYCFFDQKWLHETPRDRFISYDRWISAWMDLYRQSGPAKIIITGGEPTLYPEFADLLGHLTRYHRVSFDTNLFRKLKWVSDFARKIDSRHAYIGMSFHPEFSDLSEFIPKAREIRDAGADYRVHLICYPPLLATMPEIYEKLTRSGLKVLPGPYRGRFENRQYPESYTSREREVILSMGDNLTLKNMFWVERQMDPVNPFGKKCYAGQRYARIENDGTVWRCNQYLQNNEKPMGNIFESGFRLDSMPRTCSSKQCGCEWWWLLDYYERRHQA